MYMVYVFVVRISIILIGITKIFYKSIKKTLIMFVNTYADRLELGDKLVQFAQLSKTDVAKTTYNKKNERLMIN